MATTKEEVRQFLDDFTVKTSVFQVVFSDYRGKNTQALLDLQITPAARKEYLKQLKPEDYSEGPNDDRLYGISSLWVFGKEINGNEVYIKISMGRFGLNTICISFHKAEHKMNYPFKK